MTVMAPSASAKIRQKCLTAPRASNGRASIGGETLAAGLTGTLRLLWDIADSVVTWATRLVFSPVVWLGIVLAGVSAALFVVSGILRRRTASRPAVSGAPPRGQGRPAVSGDDDMAEIEALLKKHGIG